MTIAEKLSLIARNVQKVFDGGKKTEYNAFWDNYQENGNRKNYFCAFSGVGWTPETFKPKHPIKPDSAYMIFGQSCKAFVNQSDLSEDVVIDFSETSNMQYMFYTNTIIETLGVINASKATNITGMFGQATALREIEQIIFTADTGKYQNSNPFQNCSKLKHVIFSGVVACNGINLQWSTNLDIESLRSLLNCLIKTNANGKTITLASNHESLIENDTEAKTQLEAAKSAGWTIVYN